MSAGYLYRAWWIALAVLLVVAVVRVVRHRDAVLGVPMIVGAAMAAQYLFTVSYAAPRFLIPAYALLSVPAASAVLTIASSPRRRRWRVPLRLALIGALVAQGAIQEHVITAHLEPGGRAFATAVRADVRELSSLGVRRPCLVLGDPGWNEDLAYAAGCTDVPSQGPQLSDRLEDGAHVVWLAQRPPARTYPTRWRRLDLPEVSRRPLVAFVSRGYDRPPDRRLIKG